MSDLDKNKVSDEEISLVTKILERLIAHPIQLFEMDEQKRIDLLKVSGQLSRPNREEFKNRKKDAKKAAERKRREREKHARKVTGIRSARENTIFVAPKMLGESDISIKTKIELENTRNCYVCKKMFSKKMPFRAFYLVFELSIPFLELLFITTCSVCLC